MSNDFIRAYNGLKVINDDLNNMRNKYVMASLISLPIGIISLMILIMGAFSVIKTSAFNEQSQLMMAAGILGVMVYAWITLRRVKEARAKLEEMRIKHEILHKFAEKSYHKL